MSQPDFDHDRAGLDPLLAFKAEPGAAESPVTSAESPVNEAPPRADGAAVDRQRLDQFERSLDRALTEIAALKSDQATLVAALDDLKKRQSRPASPATTPAAQTARPRRRARGALAAIVIVALVGAAAWTLASAQLRVRSAELRVQNAELTVQSAEPGVQSAPPVVEPPPVAPRAVDVARTPPDRLSTPNSALSTPNSALSAPNSALSAPYVGTLSIDASPGGRVFINRNRVGDTPVRAEKLRAGAHLVWIERDGYRRWTRVVTVSANRVSRVFADLEPLPGR